MVESQQPSGQQSADAITLQLNQPLSGTLKADESHAFKLRLPAQTFARVLVIQKGVDVFVRAFDLQRKRLAHANDSFGRTGPQLLVFVAETAGEYRVEITARPLEMGGTYEVTYIESRAVTGEDRTRVAANDLVVAGNVLRSRAVDELNREALAPYDKALKLYKQINDKAGQATCLQYFGGLYQAQSASRKALEYFSAALALWREVPDRRGVAYTTERIGLMEYYLGNVELALSHFKQAIEIYRELGNKEAEGATYGHIAEFYRQKGDVGTALDHYQKALDLFREVGAKASMAYLLNNLGVTYRDIGDLKRAADFENQALVIWRELNHKHGTASALTHLASIYSQQGEMRKALSSYQQALPLCVALGDRHCEARVYSQVASVYDSLGETQTALDHYAKAAAIYRERAQTVGLARMLNSAGDLYSLLGDRNRALEFHTEALGLSRKAQSKIDEAKGLSSLAELYATAGETQKAHELYQQALTISREIKNRQGEAANLNRLGLLASSGGKSQEAINLFNQALAMHEALGAKPDSALTLNNLGLAYDGLGDAKLAFDYFTRALTVFREIENKSGEALMLYRVASVQKKLGQTQDARRNILKALEIVETIRGKIASTDLRSSYLSTVQDYYGLYIDLLMQEHRNRPNDNLDLTALQVSEQARARSLLDLLQEAKADVRQGVNPELLAREKELLELINGKAAQQQQIIGDPRKVELAKSLGEEIGRLSDEYESLEARIRQSNPRYADLIRATPPTLTDLQKLLDEQTILLEYKLGGERSYLWVVSATGLESFELPARAGIESLARQFYHSLTERNRSPKGETPIQKRLRLQEADLRVASSGQQLSTMLLGPVGPAVANKRLLIVADGALQYVPFNVLVSAEVSTKSAPAAVEVMSLPSIAVLRQLRNVKGRTAPAKSVAIFADPVFESDDPRLPVRRQVVRHPHLALSQSQSDFDFGTNGAGLPRLFASRDEAKAIVALAPAGTSYQALDFQANREQALKSDLNQYRVLHFATHGLLNTSRPQFSGIVLSLYDEKGRERDGFLRLNQIYNLRLSNELVVLSACSTALGKDVKGEGLIGLTRGFMYAGAPRVIASLWKVDDEATTELMKLFYRNLLQKQIPASAALSAAQAEMRAQPRWRSPYYWAAFTLQGDWR